jgi:dGTPase
VCHWGEKHEQKLEPDDSKDITRVDFTAARTQRPATIEGCVVRMCDTISYLGRDYEDATMAKLVKRNCLPYNIKKNLGTNNSRIIGTLVDDLVKTSRGKNFLMYSEKIFQSMEEMRDFNDKNIYQKQELSGQRNRIQLIFNQIFDHFLKELEQGTGKHKDYYCLTFAEFIRDMKYTVETPDAQKVVDFIAGMTDNFALGCFEDLFSIERVI